MRVRQANRNVHVVDIPFERREGWSQDVLLRSDAHHDNAFSNWELEKKHLDEAKQKDAPIIDAGDLFCAMQGKYDKRSDLSQCREEHRVSNYLDALVDTAVKFYEPYAEQFVVLGLGNHETSVIDRHGVNLTQSLADRLTDRTKTKVHHGGYTGWVRFRFIDNEDGRCRFSKILMYDHGRGGGGPVTKGAIANQRRQAYFDADIIHTGHIHEEMIDPRMRVYLSHHNTVVKKRTWHVTTPGYKDEWRDGMGGFGVERIGKPKPIGAAWLTFTHTNESMEINCRLA